MESINNIDWVTKNLRLELSPWIQRETKNMVLLKECNNKMTSNEILLYSENCALLNNHQRNFLLEQLIVNPDRQQRKFRVRGFGMLFPKQDVFIRFLPSGLRETCIKSGRKSIRAQRNIFQQATRPSNHNRTDIHEITKIITVHAGPIWVWTR